MNTRKEKLVAKVAAVNSANAEATRLHQILHDIFAPLVGQKILKVDGSLLSKVNALVPQFQFSRDLHVYRESSIYSLVWTVKSCESMPPHSCMYHSTHMYIGTLSGLVLESMKRVETYRSDYVFEEIEAKRQSFESAKRVADDLRDDLYPFGEDDR